MKLHIFIESGVGTERKRKRQFTNEWHFVKNYVHHLRPDIHEEDVEIIDVGGKDKLRMFDNQMKENARKKEHNVVLFDCDHIATGGGLEIRVKGFTQLQKELGIRFDYFLFPNNQDEGAFEDLLIHIVNPKHSGVIDCFSKYEQCMQIRNTQMNDCYEMPNVKAKIYTYITSFKRSSAAANEVKHGNWDFLNTEYWDLDNEYLNLLKQFLEKYI